MEVSVCFSYQNVLKIWKNIMIAMKRQLLKIAMKMNTAIMIIMIFDANWLMEVSLVKGLQPKLIVSTQSVFGKRIQVLAWTTSLWAVIYWMNSNASTELIVSFSIRSIQMEFTGKFARIKGNVKTMMILSLNVLMMIWDATIIMI